MTGKVQENVWEDDTTGYKETAGRMNSRWKEKSFTFTRSHWITTMKRRQQWIDGSLCLLKIQMMTITLILSVLSPSLPLPLSPFIDERLPLFCQWPAVIWIKHWFYRKFSPWRLAASSKPLASHHRRTRNQGEEVEEEDERPSMRSYNRRAEGWKEISKRQD